MRQLAYALVALAFGAAAQAAPDPQAILVASDAVRNPDTSFSLTNSLVEYRKGKQTDASTLTVYSHADKASGQFRSLIRYAAPARDANKLILYNGKDMWFHDPANKATIRLAPQERLLGQASNGDVATVNLAKDYRATAATGEQIQDGDRRARQCYKLELSAHTADASYHRIELWVDSSTSQSVKARFFSASGKLLKTAYYRRYSRQLGGERPTETVIIDGLDPTWVTLMRYTDWVKREVPEAWLQRDYLARFKPE